MAINTASATAPPKAGGHLRALERERGRREPPRLASANAAPLPAKAKRPDAEVGTGVVNSEWPQLRLFVWQAAGRSSSAFDIPPQILIDMQAFYGDVELMLNDGEAHQNFRSLSQSNSYDRNQFKQRLVAQLKLADTSIVPALNNEIGAAEQLTKKYSD